MEGTGHVRGEREREVGEDCIDTRCKGGRKYRIKRIEGGVTFEVGREWTRRRD